MASLNLPNRCQRQLAFVSWSKASLCPANSIMRTSTSASRQRVAIDFIAHFEPLQKREYRLEWGPAVSPAKKLPPGLELKHVKDSIVVNNRNVVRWTVPRDLKGFLKFQLRESVDYLDQSPGFVFRDAQGKLQRLADREPDDVQITRQGPISCAVRFSFRNWPPGCASVVDLQFVRTKSWVRMDWQLTGETDRVVELGLDMRLQLNGREKLVDIGGDDFLYSTVRQKELIRYDAAPASSSTRPLWQVRKGTSGKLTPIVVAKPGTKPHQRGWVHVMDDRRCTALAVTDFAKRTHDRIEISGDGRLTVWRRAESSNEARLRLETWSHFVTMPVHKGARTGPQSMMSPLQVQWSRR